MSTNGYESFDEDNEAQQDEILEEVNEDENIEQEIQDLDDIELDVHELRAYELLLKARQKIKAMNAPEEERALIAKAILPSHDSVYNEKKILDILSDVRDKKPWVETLTTNSSDKIELENYEDDLKREMAL